MSATAGLSAVRTEGRPYYLAVILGLACAFVIGKAVPSTMDAISAIIEPLCASSDPTGSTLDTVEPISSHALPNVPGKSLRAVLVEYGPGGASPSHRHPQSAFIYARVLEGAIRSKVNDAPERTYQAGESWTEKPGDHHQVSANASTTAPAKLLAVLVLDTKDHQIVIPDK
jgi:quercetin dioxygenase-like cupin family protein